MRTLTLILALMAPTVAFAQDDALDMKIDTVKAEIKLGKKALKDDKKDLKAIQKLRDKWASALEKDDPDKIADVSVDIQAFLREEVAERRMETDEARGELAEAGGEIAPDEVKGSPDETAVAAGERADLRGERSDLRRTREIAEELKGALEKAESGSLRGPGAETITTGLAQLERAAERDVAQTEKEIAEDERELERLKSK